MRTLRIPDNAFAVVFSREEYEAVLNIVDSAADDEGSQDEGSNYLVAQQLVERMLYSIHDQDV